MSKNLNTNPYFDDFDPANNHLQILFKPEFAVQARELTQIQSILKNQIAQFGNHVFRQGSVVIPGNSFSEMAVPYLKVAPTYNGSTVSYDLFEGKIIVGDSSGVKAYVKKVVPANGSEPITFYLSYTSGGSIGGVPNGKVLFDPNEAVRIESMPSIAAYTEASPTGAGSMAFVNDGVYYVNGSFVHVSKQSVIMSKYDSTPSCHVLLKISEKIIDSSDDETLLDPAQGSYNFSAPGADRLVMGLELVTLPIGSNLTDDYIELMRYENGELLEHFNSPKYSELEKSLAQRTYDESGDYVVNGFQVDIQEHRKEGVNGGLLLDGDFGKMVYTLSPGKAYVRGLSVENLASKRIVVDKARTANHVIQGSSTIKPSWGQYLMVANPQGTLNIQARETIQLWNISAISGGTQIGTAKVLGLDYLIGDGSASPIYKLYISDITLTSGSYDDIGSVRLASANFSAKVVSEYDAPISAGAFSAGDVVTFNSTSRVATVSFYDTVSGLLYAHKHSASASPKAGDTIVGPSATALIKTKTMIGKTGTGSLVFQLPSKATKALKNSSNGYDLGFTQWAVLNIAAGSTTASIGSGTLVPIEAGTFIALTTSGTDARINYTLGGGGTTVTRSTAAPVGGVTIYCQVERSNAVPRTKSIATHNGTYSPAAFVSLSHSDVYQIVSIVSNGIDITSRFSLETGQTDYDYNISSIRLKSGFAIPSNNLTVSYKYFSHSVGDFFSVDSYPLGLTNDMIPSYKSSASGLVFQLRDCIDFRKTIGMSSNIVVPDTFIETSIQSYGSRIDVVCIDKQGKLSVINGTPAISPKVPVVPTTLYALDQVRIPAFTYKISDIVSKRVATPRYTMEGVASLENRILNVEQYSMLSAAEAKVTNSPFIDAATGLDRFKTGYLVESMEDPFQIANASDDNFTASINRKFGITAKMEEAVVNFSVLDSGIGVVNGATPGLITPSSPVYTSSTVFNTNGVFTLPYYDKVFASVGVSSKLTNINPFNIIGWVGNLSLNPPSDVWVDVLNRPEIINNVTQTVTNTVWFRPPQPAPAPSPGGAFSSQGFVIGPVGVATPAPAPEPAPAPVVVQTPIVVGPAPAPAPAPVVTPAPAPAAQYYVGENSGSRSGGWVNLETNAFTSTWGQTPSPPETNWWNGD